MEYKNDTICALSTPPGVSGIAVIRVSGKDAINVVDSYFKGKKSINKSPGNRILFGKIYDETRLIDEVCISLFRNPHSYTGEDVVEISCHGNPFISNQILELLLRKARLAEPGEFTERAFFNNKLDLTRAEAVGDLLNAQTRRSHRAAIEQLEGSLFNRIGDYLEKLKSYRVRLELEIDFLEQGLTELDMDKLKNNLQQLQQDLKKLAATGDEGIILKEGYKISLVGAPNVGKSSIFNRLLETERAIVTPIPGTTRDYLEEVISVKGYMLRLFDTAGIRETEDQVEQIGMKRSYDVIKESNRVLYICDGNEGKDDFRRLCQYVDENKIIKVLNKRDLHSEERISAYQSSGYIICSTVAEEGLKNLKHKILNDIEISDEELHSGILSNTRQIAAVNKAVQSLDKAIESIDMEMGFEYTAFDLKEASSALEEIIGRITTEDILSDIFANFCVGK